MIDPLPGDLVAVKVAPFTGTEGIVLEVYGNGPHAGVTILVGDPRRPANTVELTFVAKELELLETPA